MSGRGTDAPKTKTAEGCQPRAASSSLAIHAGELLLTADLWASRDSANWWADGFALAPRIGARLLLGYGHGIRWRVRIDIAPTILASNAQGIDASAARAWVRAGVDFGGFTVGAWLMASRITARRTDRDEGSEWATGSEVGAGLAFGLRRDLVKVRRRRPW